MSGMMWGFTNSQLAGLVIDCRDDRVVRGRGTADAGKRAARRRRTRPDEPIRGEFSMDAAVRFLDAAALNWQKDRKCFACHSDYAFLFTRPLVSWKAPAHEQLRSKLEDLAEHPRDVKYRVTEAVMVASVLAQNDALTTGKLHPTTRKALDRMWTMQREDGGFDWMKYNQPPSEIDDHYGVTMAAIGVGAAPDDYAETPAAKAGLDKIRDYFENNPPANLHHRAMKLLASLHVDGIMTEAERQQVVQDLFALQKPDGGWGVVTMGNWQRSDDKPQDMESSDGYGTGFAVYVLRQAGVPADEPRIQKGIAWLKTHQRPAAAGSPDRCGRTANTTSPTTAPPTPSWPGGMWRSARRMASSTVSSLVPTSSARNRRTK